MIQQEKDMKQDLLRRLYEETIKSLNGDKEADDRIAALRQSTYIFCICASGIERDKKDNQ